MIPSIDAVFVAIAVTGMLVIGLRPVILEGLTGIAGVVISAPATSPWQ